MQESRWTTCVVQGRSRYGSTTCTKPEARSATVALDRGPMFCHAQTRFQGMLQTLSGCGLWLAMGVEGQSAHRCSLCPAAEARWLGSDEWGRGRAPFIRRAAPGRSSAGSVCSGDGGGDDDGGEGGWVDGG